MENLTHRIIVVGIGPGHPDYILPAALAAIRRAAVLVGGRRILKDFAKDGQRTFPVTADITGVIDFIREELKTKDVTVTVSGDPGYYSLLDTLRREFSADIIDVLPGISSLQAAFARLALPWHDARLVSLHGRDAEDSALLRGAPLGMLTDGKNNSRTIAARLLSLDWQEGDIMYVCERLSYEDEKITRLSLGEAANTPPIGHGVIVVVGEESR